MLVSSALQFLVTLFAVVCTVRAPNTEVIESLIQAYGTGEAESTSYFSSHGKAMFQQVSMLDAMALAKRGKALEASHQLTSLAVQSILANLPIKCQAAGDLLKLMQSDRSLFKDTIAAVQSNLKTVSDGIKQKLTQFRQTGSQTKEDKLRVQEDIKNGVRAKQGMLVYENLCVS